MQYDTDSAASDRNQLLYRNARQIERIVEATYSVYSFSDHVETLGAEALDCDHLDGGEMLACRWSNILRSMVHDEDDARQIHLNKAGLVSI